MNKNIFQLIVPIIIIVLFTLNSYGVFSLENHPGECRISKQLNHTQTDKGTFDSTWRMQGTLSETQCIELCQHYGDDSSITTKCSFQGITGTSWHKTSDYFPVDESELKK